MRSVLWLEIRPQTLTVMPLTQNEFSSLKKSRATDCEIHDVLTKAEEVEGQFYSSTCRQPGFPISPSRDAIFPSMCAFSLFVENQGILS